MKQLTVNSSSPYQIVIERGVLKDAGTYCRRVSAATRAVVVSDSNVAKLYAKTVASSLQGAGFLTTLFVFPAGESSKRLSTVEKLYHHLCESSITRSDLIVALGGGVTGDMAGFTAATYLRGVDFVGIPTSLLSQIDSSVGGKTGVDLPEGKNLVGAFYSPRLVLIDPDALKTLPPYYFADGMAEAIKYGCIKSGALFSRLEQEDAFEFLEELIYRCVDIKRQIVENDEKEKGQRILLNFGHTIGHALEKIYHYDRLSHGQAVAIGMAMLTKASEAAGITKPGTYQRIVSLLKRYSLKQDDDAAVSDICTAAAMDKKNTGDFIQLILLKTIGESFVHQVSLCDLPDLIRKGDTL